MAFFVTAVFRMDTCSPSLPARYTCAPRTITLTFNERLVPGFRHARALRVWAGVRPLFQDARAGEVKDTRDVSRTHAVVDHAERDGIAGLLTMSGGKLTTLRLMAEDLVDAMCAQRGEDRPCRTKEVKPPGDEDADAAAGPRTCG